MKNLWKRTACGLLAALMLLGAGCSGQPAASPAPAEATPVPSETAEQAKTTTFVDDLGRELELELPITRACVANRYNNELIRAVGAGDCVVAVDIYTSQDSVYWPQFGEEETFGKDEYDYEKIVALDPQVLIVPRNGQVEESIEQLEPLASRWW